MFAKLFLVILVLGGTAGALLVDRQQRLDLAAELARTHRRLRQHEHALWRLRTEIDFATRPADVRRALERLDRKMVPIPGRLDQRAAIASPAPVPPVPGRRPPARRTERPADESTAALPEAAASLVDPLDPRGATGTTGTTGTSGASGERPPESQRRRPSARRDGATR
ncbi:MAG TPA: hypothetical protein PKC43_01595 [Phycisphaerales bacterium]|nr:hypothetical protein [Phycisphaerales bacterium]HMP36119.1 hypothetical protein [Phycisphaerales bacterium]